MPAAPFAAFRQSQLLIDRLETPVEPPYAAGSTKGAAGLSSTDPAVVASDGLGNLIAHRNGEAQVRTQSGSVLKVTVLAAGKLAIEPASLELQVGESKNVQVLVDGQPVAVVQLKWQTENPDIAAAFGAVVQAGLTPGTVSLTALLGDAKAQVAVVVKPSTAAMTVEPAQVAVSIGAVQQLKVPAVYASAVKWSSSNNSVLQHLHDGLFLAKAGGSVRACAERGGVKTCSKVEVIH